MIDQADDLLSKMQASGLFWERKKTTEKIFIIYILSLDNVFWLVISFESDQVISWL